MGLRQQSRQNPNFREGIICVRRVEIESDFAFEILYERTWSNIDAIADARARVPHATFISATPERD